MQTENKSETLSIQSYDEEKIVPKNTVTCNGKEFLLSDAIPLNLGDLRDLEKRGCTIEAFKKWEKGQITIEEVFQLLFVMLHKLDEEITEEHVEQMHLDESTFKSIEASFRKEETGNPTS